MACRLCNLDKKLMYSHVIPEFLYKPLYDEKHRAIQLSNINGSNEYQRRKLLQKGLRERLLCCDCEQMLNDRYEKYFKDLWFDQKALPNIMESGSNLRVSAIDYHKFKMFHLSVLFRASVSSLQEFQNVALGPHEENIRKLILGDLSTLDTEYVILCHAITKNDSKIQYGLITSPFRLRQPNGYISYCFCFGGCVWYYIVDSRNISTFSSFMLNSKGEITITQISWETFLNL